MSTLYGAKRIGVILWGAMWLLMSGLYGLVRLLVFVVGGGIAGVSAFMWVSGFLFDVPDARHTFGPIFLWSSGAVVLLITLGDLVFRRGS